MKKFLLFLVLVSNVIFVSAQQISLNDFYRLEAKGQLPNDLSNIIKGLNFDGSIPKNDIQKASNDNIKELLLTGRIVYGDTVTKYLEKVLDNLLVNDSKLRKEIKIYTIKSAEANAFMNGDGFLFVTIGFIAQSTSEAEIAYVISHELIHYVKKHSQKEYDTKGDKIQTIDDYLKYHSRSREQEFECDKLGYENFFKNTTYDSKAVDGMFDILQYSYLPFDEVKLSRDIFENEYYKFNDSYFLQNITPIVSREDYIDTFSTHPNLKSRRNEMESIVSSSVVLGTSKFIQPQSSFEFIRTISRFETINQQIITNNYIKAYYNTLCLIKDNPDNKFLKTALNASLYGIAKAKISGNYQDIDLGTQKTEGEMQFVVNLFKKMNKKELALLSLRQSWDAMKSYPKVNYFKLLFNDMVKALVEKSDLGSLNKFSDYRMGEVIVEDTTANDNENKTKYDKVKNKRLVGHLKSFKTENYMLADLKKDEEFVKAFNSSLTQIENQNANDYITSLRDNTGKSKVKKKIIVLNPYAEKAYRSGKPSSKSSKETQTKRLEKRIENIAKVANLNPVIISNYQKELSLNYQLNSRLIDYSRSLNKFSEITYESRDSETLAKELGTPILNLVYYEKKSLGYKKNKTYKRLHTLFSSMTLPTLPFSIYQWIFREQAGKLVFISYDLENNKTIYSATKQFEHENTFDMLNQELYECYVKTNNLSKN
mgnify:FL=1